MRTRPSIHTRGQQRWSALLLVAAIGLAASPAFASDATLLFEGALHASGGGPASDGDYSLTFALYDAVDGKTALWTESAKVAVAGGRLRHVLGSVQALDATVAEKSALWLGVTVQGEPELPRQPLHAGFWALRAGSAAVAKAISCTGCVSVAALKFDGDIDLGGNGLKANAITAQKLTAQEIAAQSVTAASFVGDGSKLTGLALPSGSCASGQVVTGIAADGKLVCKSTAGSLPADGLDEVSNNLLTTQFIESFTLPGADVGKAIPDNTGVDLVSTIDIGSVGIAEGSFVVDVKLVNSDLSKVSIVLLPPDDKKVGIVLCDPCGAENAKDLDTSFPKPTASKTGDLSAWIGKNPKGLWNLRVKDTGFCIPQLDKVNCDVANGTDGKLLSWGLRFGVQSSALVGVQGTLVVGGSGSVHTAAAGITAEQQGKAALVAGFPALWTLVVPDFAAQQKVAVPGQMVYRSDLGKTFVRQGKEWRELLTGPMCGDGVRAGSEVCDGDDLNKKTCADAKGAGSTGTLGCKADCTDFDVSKCTEPPYFSGSKILDADGITKVNAWYGNPQQQWTLCYRRSDDGASSSTFHNKCNNKGATLTVIKNNNGYVFGGYAPVSWTSKGSYVGTTASWLYSVTSNTKFPYYQNSGNSMYDNASYGPTWGGNHDLYVEGNMSNGYGNPGYSHNCPMCSGSCSACQNAMGGSNSWNVVELEVWVKN